MDNTNEFDKSLEELRHFGDCFKFHERQLKRQYLIKSHRQKKEFAIQLQKEQEQIEQLLGKNRALTDRIEEMIVKQIDFNEKYATLNTQYISCLEESTEFKEKCTEKNLQIEQLQKHISISKDELVKLKNILEKLKETPSEPIPTSYIQLAEQAVTENQALKKLLLERDTEILRLNEQLTNESKEIEERLLHHIAKLKIDFGIMYEKQSTFFLEKISLLTDEHIL